MQGYSFMQSTYRGDDVVADALNRLKDQLSESNNVNIGNLTSLNTNIQLLFNYFRDAFLVLAQQKEALQCRLASIQSKLKKNNLAYLLEGQPQAQYKNEFWSNLETLNQKMRTTITRKNDFQAINCDTRSQRSAHNLRRSAVDRQANSNQYRRASNFVREHLVGKLEVEPSRTVDLPKNAILNLYLKWRQKRNDPVEYHLLSSVQMALTSEIKRQFPDCTHSARSFRGIRFLHQFQSVLRNELKTDVKPSQMECDDQDEESPELPTFADDHLAV